MFGSESEKNIPFAVVANIDTYDDDSILNSSISVDELRLKLKLGANPNIREENGKKNTPLLKIINEGSFRTMHNKVTVLLNDPRTDVNLGNTRLSTALMAIVVRLRFKKNCKVTLKVMRLLLNDKRIDVNAKNIDGNNALIFSLGDILTNLESILRPDIVELLLQDKRVDVNVVNKLQNNALRHLFLVENITKADEDKDEIFYCFELFLERQDLNINYQYSDGNNILMKLLILYENNNKKKYSFLKECIFILIKDPRNNIFIKNEEGKSVKNLTSNIDILNLLAGEI